VNATTSTGAEALSAPEIDRLQIFLSPSSCYKAQCFACFGFGSELWLASFVAIDCS
jgi:hypothetical protein